MHLNEASHLLQSFYDQVFQTLYREDIEKIKKLLEERNFVLIYVDEKDHPAEFFSFITKFLQASVKRKLAEPSDSTELPAELIDEDASSAEFLSIPGLEIWWVSNVSPPRVNEVMRKLIKAKWARSIVMLTDDESLFFRITRIEKDALLALQPLKNDKLVSFVEHYAVSLNFEEVKCLESLKDARIEAHMADVEKLVQFVQEAVAICHLHRPCQPSQCSGVSTGLAETLLIHFSQGRTSLLVSLRKRMLDFVDFFYEKRSHNNLAFRIRLKELLALNIPGVGQKYPIDSLIMIMTLRDLRLACLDFENEQIIFHPSKEDSIRRINVRCFAEIIADPNSQENPDEVLLVLGASQKQLATFQTLIRRGLNDNIALNLGVLLWLRKQLANIFPETCPTQSEIRNLLFSSINNRANHYSAQWNRSLDFLQSLERLDLPKELDIGLLSMYLNKRKLTPARKIAEYLLHNLLERSMRRLQSLLVNGKSSDAVLKLRDSLCGELCDGVVHATDLGIILDTKTLIPLVETLSQLVTLIDYRDPENKWKEIGSKILATAVSTCSDDRSICQNIFFISESLRFEDNFDNTQKKIQRLTQAFESLKDRIEEGAQTSLGSFHEIRDLIFELHGTFTDFNYIVRKLSDTNKMESAFEKLYQNIVSWAATEKRLGILNSLLVSDIICQAFGLFNAECIPSEFSEMLSVEFDDVVLLVVDAMPSYFSDLFQRSRKFDLKTFVGFSVFPSETAPGHVSIFTGIPPIKSHVFSNDLVFRRNSVSLLDSGRFQNITEQHEYALQDVYGHSIVKRLKSAGIQTVLFIPANYRKSLLTKIVLGGSLNNATIHDCRKGVDIFKEAQMIPTSKASKRFYIILDNEIDVTQHAGLKRYYYEEKETGKLSQLYKEYFDRLTSFLHFIIQNATKKGRKLLVIVTADHGVATLKYVDSSFSDLLQECGLGFIGSRGRVINCPQPTKLHGGIYSKYDLTLLENPHICSKIGLNRQQAQSSRIGIVNVHTLHSINRVVFIRVNNPARFDSMRVVSAHCSNCGYSDLVVMTNQSFCPKCGAHDMKIVEMGTLRSRFLDMTKAFGFHIVFPSSQTVVDNSSMIWDPHLIIFPRFDSIFSKYPSTPRECIMHLLKVERKPLSRDDLKRRYAQFYTIDQLGEENESDFDEALQDLIDLHHVEERTDGCVAPITEDYSGTCTVITHGGISPPETMVPFVILRNARARTIKWVSQ